jgi:4-amino-4-deoxy-L-arabinose transferase-like glycosyltransferase
MGAGAGGADRWSRPVGPLARGLLALAFCAQVSNAFLLPRLHDYDAAGHALYAFALYQGRMPEPTTWGAFHPPLTYALGAAVWRLTGSWLPADVALRLVSVVAGLLAVLVVQRALRRRVGEGDAALVALVAYCTPAIAIATVMMGNEALCILLVTAVLARVVDLPRVAPEHLARHALGTGVLAALAVLTKVTAVIAVPVVGAAYLWRFRDSLRRAMAGALLVTAVPALAGGLFFGHLMRATGSCPSVVLSGSRLSPETRAEMQQQGPGVRWPSDYVSFPIAAITRPYVESDGLATSVPGLFYATLQADAMGEVLPAKEQPGALRAGALLATAGLLPTALGLLGLLRLLRRPRAHAWLVAPTAYALLLALAFATYQWSFPHFSAGKASYVSSALLPAAGWLVLGLGGLPARAAVAARFALLAVAALAVALLWQGWWR